MKKNVIKLVAIFFIASAILIGCNTPAAKEEDAKENVDEAKEDLDKANQEYLDEVQNYRNVTAAKIIENDKTIADFRLKIQNEKKEVKANYEIKITALDQKNKNLKQKMDDYNATGKTDWEKFKEEFNHDMDELGKAFQDLIVNNEK